MEILLAFAIVTFSATILIISRAFVKALSDQRRIFNAVEKDLLDRLMFAQGRPFPGSLPRVEPEPEEDQETTDWRDL